MALIQFVQNYDDMSNSTGFQFRFYCDRCHNGYLSSFEQSRTNTAESLMRNAGGLLGGLFGRAAEGLENAGFGQMIGSREHDAALQRAVAEVKGKFKQCPRCGTWVCPEICWNEAEGECVHCTPKLAQEVKQIRSDARLSQLRDAAYADTTLSAGVNLHAGDTAVCPSCGAAASGGKFCQECGSPLAPPTCKGCGVQLAPRAKFCPECGTRA